MTLTSQELVMPTTQGAATTSNHVEKATAVLMTTINEPETSISSTLMVSSPTAVLTFFPMVTGTVTMEAVGYEKEEDEGVERFPFSKPKGVVLPSENRFFLKAKKNRVILRC